jgi:hypothetical protein
VIPVGSSRGSKLGEFSLAQHQQYLRAINDYFAKENKPIAGSWKELVNKIVELISRAPTSKTLAQSRGPGLE